MSPAPVQARLRSGMKLDRVWLLAKAGGAEGSRSVGPWGRGLESVVFQEQTPMLALAPSV